MPGTHVYLLQQRLEFVELLLTELGILSRQLDFLNALKNKQCWECCECECDFESAATVKLVARPRLSGRRSQTRFRLKYNIATVQETGMSVRCCSERV